MKILSAGKTDTGKKRTNNEDSYLADQALGLYAVADGIGGHSGGEVASRMAVEIVRNELREHPATGQELSVLASAFQIANRRIVESGERDPALSGMGTTLTALFLDGATAHLAHAGDSRAYLQRDGILEQVTDDHSVVAEQVRAGLIRPDQAKKSAYRHIITRALGIEPELPVDQKRLELKQGDIFLLCTDGLTEMVEDPLIERVLRQERLPDAAAERLIRTANEHGGVDNITVVVIRIDELG